MEISTLFSIIEDRKEKTNIINDIGIRKYDFVSIDCKEYHTINTGINIDFFDTDNTFTIYQRMSFTSKNIPKWINKYNRDLAVNNPNYNVNIEVVSRNCNYISDEIDSVGLRTLFIFKLLKNRKCTLVSGICINNIVTSIVSIKGLFKIEEYNLKCGKMLHLVYN